MPEDSAQERTEQATPRRRQEARKKGTVTRSVELTSSVAMLGLLLAVPYAATLIGRGFLQSVTAGFTRIPLTCAPGDVTRFLWMVCQPNLAGIGLLLALAVALGVGATAAQVGFVFAPEALVPSFAKLNPLTGMKRLASASFVFDAAKALAKTLIFGLLAYAAISVSWDRLVGLGWLSPSAALAQTGELVRQLALKIVAVWLALAGIDYFFQRRRVEKQLMMSKQEIKEEMRRMEQHPEVRAAQARRRHKMARGRMMESLKKASVVVTNPTHFAVALEYDAAKQIAPVVVAKGADFLAAKIREVAEAHGIPLVSNPPLARALYRRCELGDVVPAELFQPVAEVLAYVYKTIKKVRGGRRVA